MICRRIFTPSFKTSWISFTDYRHKRLYIIGESYAGYYAPSMAHKVHQMNKKNKDPTRHINLAGVGVGNGWVDAKVQGEAVIDYAYLARND